MDKLNLFLLTITMKLARYLVILSAATYRHWLDFISHPKCSSWQRALAECEKKHFLSLIYYDYIYCLS